MKGTLEVNLDPAYIGFECNEIHQIHYCREDELQGFLVALNLLDPKLAFLGEEFQIRLIGDFSSTVLAKFGLPRFLALEERQGQAARLH